MHIETDFGNSDVEVRMAQVNLDGGVRTKRGVEIHGKRFGIKRKIFEFFCEYYFRFYFSTYMLGFE